MHHPHVRHVQHDAEPLEALVEVVARELHHLEHLLDALQREVLAFRADEGVARGDERVDAQQPERRGAVDQDQVVLAARLAQRALEGQLASHLAAQHQLRLGQAQVGGDHVLVDRVHGARAAGEHLADRRRRVRVHVEVVREVALRVEVDRKHVQPDPAQHVGQRSDHGRLARAALLREHGDGRTRGGKDRRAHVRLILPAFGAGSDAGSPGEPRISCKLR